MAEILAPCGSMEALSAALKTGADAVYLGGEMFSARQNAANFTDSELEQAAYLCHVRGVKIYLAINTMITDSQIEDCIKAVRFACKIGVDGLITQDPALVEIVKQCCPEMEIHASTQMTLHTVRGALQAESMGFSRVVLSRELPFEIIKEISKLPVETEVFVHGAHCMSVSGQCYMSAVVGSRSANRGLCAQPCRLPMTAVKGREEYALSLKDMCDIDYVGQLDSVGVDSLKIEGRMKRPEYVAAAVTAYRQALNGEQFDISLLESVFSRSGFTDGYIKGKTGSGMFGTRTKEDVLSASSVFPKLHELYRHEYKRSGIAVKCEIKAEKPVRVTAVDENGIEVTVTGDIPEKAISRSIDKESAEKQLSKLGNTIYTLNSFEGDIDEGLMTPASQLNLLRRELCNKLDDKRAEFFGQKIDFQDNIDLHFAQKICSDPKIRICVSKLSQLENVDFEDIEFAAIPLQFADTAIKKGYKTDKLALKMPCFTFNEYRDFELLKSAAELGYKHILCENLAHISMAEQLGLIIHTDFRFNIANSLALTQLRKLGAADAVCSPELKAVQINHLSDVLPVGIYAYGRLPLMLTVNCAVKKSVGCEKCKKRLYDRTGREFPVKCSKNQGYVEILNSEILYIADKLQDFNVDFIMLDFYDESADEVKNIISAYRKGDKSKLNKLTRGLYYRGVI